MRPLEKILPQTRMQQSICASNQKRKPLVEIQFDVIKTCCPIFLFSLLPSPSLSELDFEDFEGLESSNEIKVQIYPSTSSSIHFQYFRQMLNLHFMNMYVNWETDQQGRH